MKRNYLTTKLMLALLMSVFVISACKKEGCTDATATNYNSEAEKDDGSCVYKEEEVVNTPPTKVVFISAPDNEATDVSTPVNISWEASTDTDGDAITYDVFLGTDSGNPALVSGDQTNLTFVSDELDLTTVYYLRVDSKSGEHVTQGEVRSFTTTNMGSFTDSRDGKTYGTIKIGDQIWMTSNLTYDVNGSYSYNDNASNDDNYGRLYEWASVPSALPAGWHLPTDDEWKTLETVLGMPSSDLNINSYGTSRGTDQGTQLREGGTSGLNFPLAGFRSGGTYSALNNRTYLWTNTDVGGTNIIRRRLVTADPSCYRFTNPASNFAISVRLVKD